MTGDRTAKRRHRDMFVHTLNDALSTLWWPIAAVYTAVIWKARLTPGRHHGKHALIAWVIGLALFLTAMELAMASCYVVEHSYFWAAFESFAAICYAFNAKYFIARRVRRTIFGLTPSPSPSSA